MNFKTNTNLSFSSPGGSPGLTADGQYPNSSRNSSGFSTTDSSDRILAELRRRFFSPVRLRRGHRCSRPPRGLPTRCSPPRLHGEDGQASIRKRPSSGVPCNVVTAFEGKKSLLARTRHNSRPLLFPPQRTARLARRETFTVDVTPTPAAFSMQHLRASRC